MSNLLEVKDLFYTYPDGTQALQGVNLDVASGEKVAVVGMNGSGKSTLFLCLNGILKARSGEIFIDGQKVKYDKKSLRDLRRNVGIIFQDPQTQLFCINVYQEVAFGPNNLGIKGKELENVVNQSMAKVDVAEFSDKPPHLLSYGQKKRVSVAAVLSMNPKLIIFDEPTSALDPVHSKQIIDLMNELNAAGITVIMSTHDVDLAYAWADKVVVMQAGCVASSGTAEYVFSNEDMLSKWSLEMPVILKIYNKIKSRNLISNSITAPRSMNQLEEYIDHIN